MNLRLYSFVNMYLQGIHAGIQTGHAAVRLMRKYSAGRTMCDFLNRTQRDIVEEWASDHETFIVLNGGSHADMLKTLELTEKSGFPFVPFYESQDALNGIMTCIVVVLPESIYDARIKPVNPPNTKTNMLVQPAYTYSNVGVSIDIPETHYLFKFLEDLKSKKLAS